MANTLHAALTRHPGFAGLRADEVVPLRRKGVSHDHYELTGRGLVARVPRLSQWDLPPAAFLAYQAEAFRRAVPSGHTPALHDILAPSDDLPGGALLVAGIDGHSPHLPQDLPALATALAAIHGLPLPTAPDRPPLLAPADPFTATLDVIERQTGFIPAAGFPDAARARIDREMTWARDFAADNRLPPSSTTLVGTDTHPGNFLIDATGRAWFLDLEKAAYGNPAIDVAHLTLPTSVGWDPDCTGTIGDDALADVYRRYLARIGPAARDRRRPWLIPARRLTWLRTITWFARWRAEFQDSPAAPDDPALRDHIARHIESSLRPDTLATIRHQRRVLEEASL